MAPLLICCFIVELLYIKRTLATILPLKSKLPGNFQPFDAIDGSIEMPKNS